MTWEMARSFLLFWAAFGIPTGVLVAVLVTPTTKVAWRSGRPVRFPRLAAFAFGFLLWPYILLHLALQ